MSNAELLSKIEGKRAVVGVVGLGYVGLPLLLCFVEKGFRAVGFDIDAKKTGALERGESYIRHIPSERLAAAGKSGRMSATTDFFVAFSPEREDPNRKDYTTETIPKVIGTTSPQALEVADRLYRQIIARTLPVSSTRAAEATKLMENIFRAVNIALVNELKVGVTTRFIELAGEINSAMPEFVVRRATEVLNDAGKPLKGSRILILGLAYEANVDDDRESPSYRLMELLEERGAQVSYNDPHVPVIPSTRKYARYAGRRSVPVDGKHDLLLISTPHDAYRELDFDALGVPVVDTRNIARGSSALIHRA